MDDQPKRPTARPVPGRLWLRGRRQAAGDPAWLWSTLPALLVLAGLAYGWGMGNQVVEIYYAAAVRSMTLSWHNFFFAAVDPDATVSLDKLPGAFWLQAAAARVFGLHVWALVLPQVIEGVLAVLVLFRAVRRLAGPAAARAAACVALCMPATVALNRGNIADSLMILLLVCAVAAAARSLVTGRAWPLLLSGLWIGLAFQAKMLEAWLLLPGLALAWLVAGSGSTRRRLAVLAGLVAVTVVVSLAWIAAVSLVPAQDRPYVDGSSHDSLLDQVFVYNGFDRVGQAATIQTSALGRALQGVTLDDASPLDRTLAGPGGRDIGWLLPLACCAAVAVLVCRRRAPRTDLLRAGAILAGAWLLAEVGVFAASSTLNAYYLAALTPPIAMLIGIGGRVAIEQVRTGALRLAVLLLTAATVGYEAWLFVVAGGILCVLVPASALVLLLAGGWLLRGWSSAAPAWFLAAILVAPAVASCSLVARGWGPFDTPFEPAATAALTQQATTRALHVTAAAMGPMVAARGSARDLAATYTALLAAPFIFQSGQEVLPIGGFTGTIPEPTLNQLRQAIASGALHLVISPPTTDARIAWIAAQCVRLPGGALPAYYCGPGFP
jgi:4-amino-4-deoxy-L-arabinose transferase-like glycosyltransferase